MKIFEKIYQRLTQPKPALHFAMEELLEAERDDLRARSALDMAEASVMYNERRIARLRAMIAESVNV